MIPMGVTALVVVGGALVLGWRDAYHVTVGVAALAGALAVALGLRTWWRGRMQDDPASDDGDESPLVPRLARGIAGGLMLLGVAALAYASVAGTPLHGFFYGCETTLHELQVLNVGNAHARAVELADGRLRQTTSRDCRRRLLEAKARALLALSQVGGADAAARLAEAQNAAEDAGLPDLVAVIRGR